MCSHPVDIKVAHCQETHQFVPVIILEVRVSLSGFHRWSSRLCLSLNEQKASLEEMGDDTRSDARLIIVPDRLEVRF